MKPRLVFRLLLALLAVFSLAVAGCGNDDDAPAAEPSQPRLQSLSRSALR